MSEYTVRWLRQDDVEAFLALYRRVLDSDHSREWYEWKYAANPYVDHVPIVVAECGDEIVGARGFFALRMLVDGDRYAAMQPCDVMVEADHRRNGLFTRMTELGVERYEASDVAFLFSFPNANSFPGYRKLGWAAVDQVRASYRIADPRAVAADMADKTDKRWLGLAARLASPFTTTYNRLRDWTASVPGGVSVERHSAVPAAELADVARATTTHGIHAHRDETFYGWRFERPDHEYTVYVATGGDQPAAMITGEPISRRMNLVEIADVLPLSAGSGSAEKAALLEAIIEDNPEAALFATSPRQFEGSTLGRFGFFSDQQFPLSALSMSRTQVARPLGDGRPDGVDVTDRRNWTHAMAELDTV